MRQLSRLASSSMILACFFSPSVLCQSRVCSGQVTKPFYHLFNGKDLSGWVMPRDKSLFTVENGEIVGRTTGKLEKNEFLATEKSFGDFVLKVKVKIRNGNSGI